MQTMQEPKTSRVYDLWSKCYDHTFGALVHRRQHRALQQLRPQPGDRVLDLGVGTGMSLPNYPADVSVIGMDLSGGMLHKAAEKASELGLDHCALVQADALHPPFADGSFDRILISHTVSVVSDPAKLLRWAERLLKPGGRIVVLNHFLSPRKPVAWFERTFNPLFVKIGWRSDLPLEECLEGSGLEVRYHFKLAAIDLWQIVVLAPKCARPKPEAMTPEADAATYESVPELVAQGA